MTFLRLLPTPRLPPALPVLRPVFIPLVLTSQAADDHAGGKADMGQGTRYSFRLASLSGFTVLTDTFRVG